MYIERDQPPADRVSWRLEERYIISGVGRRHNQNSRRKEPSPPYASSFRITSPMTTRGACSEAPREVLGAPSLLNAGEGRPAGCPTETPGASMDRDPAKMAAERAAKFIIRVRRRC